VLILTELDGALAQTVSPADLFRQQSGAAEILLAPELLNLRVSELDLDLPAHLQVQQDRLIVSLPSTLEQPPAGRMGRIRLTIAPVQN
jgi:hypothetical protein